MPIPEFAGKSPRHLRYSTSKWKRITLIATSGLLGLVASLSALPPHVGASSIDLSPIKEFVRKVHRL